MLRSRGYTLSDSPKHAHSPCDASLRYTMRVGGLEGWYDMVIAALTSDRIQLSRDIADLEYLMEKMKKL